MIVVKYGFLAIGCRHRKSFRLTDMTIKRTTFIWCRCHFKCDLRLKEPLSLIVITIKEYRINCPLSIHTYQLQSSINIMITGGSQPRYPIITWLGRLEVKGVGCITEIKWAGNAPDCCRWLRCNGSCPGVKYCYKSSFASTESEMYSECYVCSVQAAKLAKMHAYKQHTHTSTIFFQSSMTYLIRQNLHAR